MYIVEGNIGAGKSTFLQVLNNYIPYAHFVWEPRKNWQSNVYGQSLLTYFYEDTHRWAYTMETFALICRVQEHIRQQEALNNSFCIMERSIYSGHYVFASNGYEHGFMSDLEWDLYNQWFDFLTNRCNTPKGFIYLHVDPEIAFKRIKKRNRISEKRITLQYLRQIHGKHESFLINKKDINPELQKVPVLILDCNEDFENNAINQQAHSSAVAAFLLKTK